MKNHRFPWLRNRTTDNRKCEKACNIKEKRTIEMFSTVSRQPVELLSSASVNRPFYIFFHLQKDLLFFCRTCRRITRSRNSISGTFCVLLKGRRKEKWLFEMLISCIPLRSMSKMVSCWYFRTVARSAYLWKRSLETDHLPKNRQSGRMPASAGSGRRGESGGDPESYAGGRGRQCRGQRGKALFLLLWTKTQPQDRESTQQPPEHDSEALTAGASRRHSLLQPLKKDFRPGPVRPEDGNPFLRGRASHPAERGRKRLIRRFYTVLPM